MSKFEVIATITAQLADADDETVEAVAAFVRSLTAAPVRPLSPREQNLLAQSRADFEAGRTLTMDEFMASTDAMLSRHRQQKQGE